VCVQSACRGRESVPAAAVREEACKTRALWRARGPQDKQLLLSALLSGAARVARRRVARLAAAPHLTTRPQFEAR